MEDDTPSLLLAEVKGLLSELKEAVEKREREGDDIKNALSAAEACIEKRDEALSAALRGEILCRPPC